MTTEQIIWVIPWYAIFLFSTVCHEAAHAFVARKGGDYTAMQYASLDPIPHIQRSKIGMIVLPLLTYFLNGGSWMIGFASVPINTTWAGLNPRKYGLVSLAGPIANFLIASVAVLLMFIMYKFLPPSLLEVMDGQLFPNIFKVLRIAVLLNVILGIFNLMPLPPLDGSAVPCIFIPRTSITGYLSIIWNPSMSLPGLFIAWYLFAPFFSRIGIPILSSINKLFNASIF